MIEDRDLDALGPVTRAAAQALAARPGHHDDCAWRPRLTLGDARRLVQLLDRLARLDPSAPFLAASGAIPDCTCRTFGCGHRASEHTGPFGACRICGLVCWS